MSLKKGNREGLDLVFLAELVPDGRDLLAVAAPGRVELDKDVAAGAGHVQEVLTHQNLDRKRVPVRGNLLRVQVLLGGSEKSRRWKTDRQSVRQ
jgi:hypothetical protein